MKTPHKKRVQVAVAILGELVKSMDKAERSLAVELLKRNYQARGLQPIRGKALPPDIYDKEMATLYVIGKYGLKLDQDYPELFEKVFYIEEQLESATVNIMENRVDDARDKLKRLSPTGVVDSNTVARLLRIPLTKLILGFMSEEEFKEILGKVAKAFPEEEKTVKNYARFFVGLKLAEAISKGDVKSREEKEALKKALAIRIGFPKSTPSDDYVREIAKAVFNVDDKVLDKVLQGPGARKTGAQETEGS